MKKETTRYRLNKYLSEIPVEKISFQADVTTTDLPRIQSELQRLARLTSLTLIVVENSTTRGVL